MDKRYKIDELRSFILKAVRVDGVKTVEQLMDLAEAEFTLPKEEIVNHILMLRDMGEIALDDRSTPSRTWRAYLFSTKSLWYWSVIILASLALLTTFLIPEEAFPLVLIRYAVGSLFILFLPGFSLVKALYPLRRLDSIETLVLSVGTSLALVTLISFILNETPWGIQNISLAPSLYALILLLSSVSIGRAHQLDR